MILRTLPFVALIASLLAVSMAVPADMSGTARQMLLDATTGDPATPESGTAEVSLPEPSPPPVEVLVMPPPTPPSTSEISTAATPTMDTAPTTGEEPEIASDSIGSLTTNTASNISFAYNIGGDAVGEFQADPVTYFVGETSIFAIPDAMIANVVSAPAEIYRSHRYGLLGTPFSLVLPIETPGFYNCDLHYAETYSEFFTEDPNRTFKVEVSGDASEDVQEAEFDVMVELKGQEFTPYIRTFENIACNSSLTIREIPIIGDAFLAGLKCQYTSPLIGM